ncbi:hypothetical protein [Methanobrevibacter curvatus]|uniref:hypothetical protein n=1 Tax=Methanobrevibacter curvatus TaxID=49547 RepID=UPI000A0252D3|nr:hypothetical protein [Methanobrevibacter curvatus]
MKKYFLMAILIISVILVSGCVTDKSSDEAPQTLTKKGIKIIIPNNWVEAKSYANDTIIAVVDPNYVDMDSNLDQVSVVIQKKAYKSSLDSIFRDTYRKMFLNSSYQLVNEGNTTVGEFSALECTYIVTEKELIKEHRAIWFKKGDYVYVVLCTAPESEFSMQEKYFNYISEHIQFL